MFGAPAEPEGISRASKGANVLPRNGCVLLVSRKAPSDRNIAWKKFWSQTIVRLQHKREPESEAIESDGDG